ncbi:dihydropteroate synthase [Alphaproteobacteria bacterium HT1-32]|nr:dihydropteroate synthase [Alphaproteobacteria bacterium HT1-32]
MNPRRYLDPVLNAGPSGAGVLALGGGALQFSHCRCLTFDGDRPVESLLRVDELLAEEIEALTVPKAYAGLPCPPDAPLLMGVVNVTPDSFSDGGDYLDHEAAIARGLALVQEGASIIDVGGESTRPGAAPVSQDEEIRRIEPVVRALSAQGILVSVDTRNARVMTAAIVAGATVVNDVTALTHDPKALSVVAEAGCNVMLMHMQGQPQTMQQEPDYRYASADVYDFLRERRDVCLKAGLKPENISVDPGIGFGKTDAHNLLILRQMAMFQGLGCAVTLGVSRKSFIGRVADVPTAKDRLPGSLAAAVAGAGRGVQILRVHDVAETRQALAVWRAISISEA